MPKALLLFVLIVAPAICSAQRKIPHGDTAIESLVLNIQHACETRNSALYISLFSSNSTWSGPMGQGGAGHDIIEPAVASFLDEIAAEGLKLRLSHFEVRPLSDEFQMVDVYQTHLTSRDMTQLPPPWPATAVPDDYRTTLLIEKQEQGWRVIDARVADLREHEHSDAKSPERIKSVPVLLHE